MKTSKTLFSLIALCCCVALSAQQKTSYPTYPALPSAEQVQWQQLEQTMFIHFAPQTWQGTELDNLSLPPARFNPSKLDVNQWIDVAESFDAKMIIFVAKHTGGFCWWQTSTTDYSVKSTPYKDGKGDVLDELARACFARGMRLGIYIYPGDASLGAYVGGGGRTTDTTKQEAYTLILRKQWEEVLSRYGDQIKEIWYDGGLVVPLEDIIRKYTTNPIVFQGPFANIRWVGNEEGVAPYPAWNGVMRDVAQTGLATGAHGTPVGQVWMPLEVNTVLKSHYWFWSPTNYKAIKSKDDLVEFYYKSVGRGGLALLNAAPDTTGLIPALDVALYKAYGDDIRQRFSKPLASTSGHGASLELQLPNECMVDHVIVQEDIVFGERVRRYSIEALVEGQWVTVSTGSSVGYKRIERFLPVKASALRFTAIEFNYPPVISQLAAFYVADEAVYTHIKQEHQAAVKEEQVARLQDIVKKNGAFSVDLSAFIPTARQYRVVAKSSKGFVPLQQTELWLEGVPTANVVWPQADGSCVINCTSAPSMKPGSIVLKGLVKNKEKNTAIYIHPFIP